MFNVEEEEGLKKHLYFCHGIQPTRERMMKQLFLAALLLLPIASFAQEEDTTFQIAHVRTLQEVLIKAEEPTWIREKLKLFIKNREANYQQKPLTQEYSFRFQDTGSDLQKGSKRTITDSLTAYRFESQGLMQCPSKEQMKQDSVFQVAPEHNTIYSTDTTFVNKPDSAFVRWTHLEDMLYTNLIQTLDRQFLRQHRFAINWDYETPNPNVVQLVFWSTKYDLDRGYLNLDTARCMVLEAERHSGLECIKHEFCNNFALWVLQRAVKLELKDWTILLRAVYSEEGQPQEFRYQSKRHFVSWSDIRKKKRQWMDITTTSRTTLLLHPATREAQPVDLIDIYPSKSIEIVNSKSRRYQMQQRLYHVPREYVVIVEH